MNNSAREPLSVRQAARALNLSPRTVDAHIVAIFNRMGVRSRVELTIAMLNPGTSAAEPSQGGVPIRSLSAIPNNVPRKLTSFIGRTTEIDAIRALVGTRQLVTLIGSAGVGKTSTSLEVAAAMLGGFDEGVWFIELAPLTEGEHIPAAVARALGLTLSSDGDPLTNLAKQLASRRMLLVFDNCEHLVEPIACALATILRDCRKVKILASSRQHLRIVGESTYRIPSLAVPDEDDVAKLQPADILRFEATRLFVERARAVDNRFTLTEENAAAIAVICQRLDGIPLAIELAAARTAVLTPQQLRDQLGERFRILTGGSRDAIARHRTLRALIDWSHDLLDERERIVFRRLGIFVHGFTLEATVALNAGDLAEGDVFDALASLVDRSLVLAEPTGDTVRYRLLESTRFYAIEKLALAEEQATIASRNIRFLRDRAVELRAQAERTGRRAEIDRFFAIELANIRAALDGASEVAEIRVAADLLAHLRQNWMHLGLCGEGAERIRRVLSVLPNHESRLFALLLGSLAHLVSELALYVEAFDLATRALAYARASGDDATLALTLYHHANKASALRKFDVAEASLAEAEAFEDISAALEISLLRARAFHHYVSGDFDSAVRTGERLLFKCRALGDGSGARQSAFNLAKYEYARGAVQKGREIAHENIRACRIAGDKWILPLSLLILAACLAAESDLVGAAEAVEEVLKMQVAGPSSAVTTTALEVGAFVIALARDVRQAAIIESFAAATSRRHGSVRGVYEHMVFAKLSAILDETIEPAERERLRAEGIGSSFEAVVALAIEAMT